MHKTGLALMLSLYLAAVSAMGIVHSVRDYPLKQLSCHVYVIYGAIGRPTPDNQGFVANSGFVVTEKGVVVIDPGSSLQAGRMVLRRIGEVTSLPVTHVINSHAHGEHWLGNQAIVETYPDVRILAHRRMLQNTGWMQAGDWIEYMESTTGGFTRGTLPVPPRVAIKGVMSLNMGDVSLRIRALESGEEETSVVVEVVEDSIAFVGEEFQVQRLDPLKDTSLELTEAEFCQVSIPAPADYYVPDHGPIGPVGMVECPDVAALGTGWKL